MKILIIHNNYGAYSGEEAVVDKQIALFWELAHDVMVYRKTSENIRNTIKGNISGLIQGFYSASSVKDIKAILKNDLPDIVIIHNLYPFISPAILKPIKNKKVPIIMVVHNYRLICPTGLFLQKGVPCELCLNGTEWNCIKYNCEHSLLKSIGYASRNWYARKSKAYINNVSIYACLTGFQAEKLIQAGYSSSSIRILPNFIDMPGNFSSEKGDYAFISGRISREKGTDSIINVARKTPDIKYVFAGTIKPEDKLNENLPGNCIFVGHLSGKELTEKYKNARFLLTASRSYEGFPMTILEASLYAKPTIAPAQGAFLDIVDNDTTGLLFVPSNESDLKLKIEQLWNNPDQAIQFGLNAYQKMKTHYSKEVMKDKWEQLLEETISKKAETD